MDGLKPLTKSLAEISTAYTPKYICIPLVINIYIKWSSSTYFYSMGFRKTAWHDCSTLTSVVYAGSFSVSLAIVTLSPMVKRPSATFRREFSVLSHQAFNIWNPDLSLWCGPRNLVVKVVDLSVVAFRHSILTLACHHLELLVSSDELWT